MRTPAVLVLPAALALTTAACVAAAWSSGQRPALQDARPSQASPASQGAGARATLEARAEAARRDGDEAALELAAVGFARLGDHRRAVDLLTELVEAGEGTLARGEPTNTRELADALRLRGQYRGVLPGPDGSVEACLADFTRSADLLEKAGRTGGLLYRSVQLDRAGLLMSMGRIDEARRANDVLLEHPPLSMQDGRRYHRSDLWRDAQLKHRAGELGAAVEALEALLKAAPPPGAADAMEPRRELSLRRTLAEWREQLRAQREGDDTPSVDYLRELRAIWEDDRLRGEPDILVVGQRIIKAHAYRHDHQRRLDASVEVLGVLDLYRERWLDAPARTKPRAWVERDVDDMARTVLSGLQSAANSGRPALQLMALDRLIAMATSEASRENLELQRDDLRERMAAGRYGPE
jgi:tetratricopeptide (TPR) repeat protein